MIISVAGRRIGIRIMRRDRGDVNPDYRRYLTKTLQM
jgi:hypothetical protein